MLIAGRDETFTYKGCTLRCFNFSICNQHMKPDIPGYLWRTCNQTLFLSNALRFCALTFYNVEDFLEKIFAILVHSVTAEVTNEDRQPTRPCTKGVDIAKGVGKISKVRGLYLVMTSL